MIKQKGFSLIELLVVVAIIGILAAVGVVAYNGYTKGAKAASSKSNQASVVKYIAAEIKKCDMGETKAMSQNLTCSGKNSSSVITAAKTALSDFKNPYGKGQYASNDTAVTDGGTYSNDYAIGYIRLGVQADYLISVGTCYAIPCNDSKNKFLDILRVLDTPK